MSRRIEESPNAKMEVAISFKKDRIPEIDQHWHNLKNLLKYSNATPFKDRTDAGYTCAYCFQTFPDPDLFRKHTNQEHDKEKIAYKAETKLNNFVIFLDILDLKCTLCGSPVDTIQEVTEHLAGVHHKKFYRGLADYFQPYKLTNELEIKCCLCTKSFNNVKLLTTHMNEHSRNFICSICGAGFVNSYRLCHHEMRHFKKKTGCTYPCHFCGQVFAAESQKRKHENAEHRGIIGYCVCQICKARFENHYQKKRHLEVFHDAEAFTCEYCGKRFSLKNNLVLHTRNVHLKEKPFECSDCPMRFFEKRKMLEHYEVTHTNKKNYQCDFCGLAFATMTYKRRHIKNHHGFSKGDTTVQYVQMNYLSE